ncbi:MAG: SDR family oxidoreductase [Candidatus Dormibacteraeota bacterium]|nr:SDR family oxidoreductase [Candidatus Dormibacteraeota bacterium]MBV9525126.1 SDR family oxidoreductase [Candidatus Dormibacteraeota bacterium]
MEIRGSVIIITGASSGIGAATARLAHGRGARVVMAARRADRLEELARELPGALAVTTDVTVDGDRRAMVDRCMREHGRIDALINNAGQGLHVPLEDVALEAFRDVLELNLVAPLALIQLVLPAMRAQRSGAIVNISSGTARMSLPGVGAYASTKAALNLLTATARRELADDGITVSLVLPSVTATEFHEVLRQGVRPDRRLPFAGASPDEVAEAVLRVVETGEEEIALAHHR